MYPHHVGDVVAEVETVQDCKRVDASETEGANIEMEQGNTDT
jgi:hypothetical protein